MELAAIILATLSVFVAGLSWRAASRSAAAAEASAQEAAEIADIEKARHLQENTPNVQVTGRANSEGLVTFTLTHTGPRPTYTVEVEAVERSYVQFLRTEEMGSVSTPRINLGDMKQGVPLSFFGYRESDTEKHQRFIIHLTDGSHVWPVYASCKIGWPPQIHSF